MTPNASTVFTDYQQRTAQNEDYLGRVIILSQREAAIRHGDLEQILLKHSLQTYLPGEPNDADVYRRVTAKAKIQKNKIPQPDDTAMNLLIRDINQDDDELRRRIVVEIVDAGNKRLSYDGVLDLVYDKRTGRMVRQSVPGFWGVIPGAADTAANEALAAFNANRGRVDDNALRSIATRVVSASHGIKLRSTGSVYFVPKSHADKVELLAAAAKELPGMQADLIRLIDDGDGAQRDMVHAAADADIAEAASRLAAEIREVSAGDVVSSRRKQSLIAEFRKLHERATAHEQLLEQTLGESRIKLTQLEFAITTVAAKREK